MNGIGCELRMSRGLEVLVGGVRPAPLASRLSSGDDSSAFNPLGDGAEGCGYLGRSKSFGGVLYIGWRLASACRCCFIPGLGAHSWQLLLAS